MSLQKPKSVLWYMLPVLLGIIGGVIAYFILRKSDSRKAKTCLLIGGVIFGISIITSILITEFSFLPDDPFSQYIATYGVGSMTGGFAFYFGIPAVIAYYIFDKIKNRNNKNQ